jgi:5-methylcytosine-specific restriction endonuclease McrA
MRQQTTKQRGYAGGWRKVRRRILERDRYTCRWCNGYATEVDHLIPITRGGPRLDPTNLVASCKSCNVRRAREAEADDGRRRNWPRVEARTRRVWPGTIDLR